MARIDGSEYAYLQKGRSADARRVARGIQSPSPLAHMAATYAIETGDWDRSPAELDLTNTNLLTNVSVLNAEGLVHLAHGRIEEARACAAAAKKQIDSPAAESSGAPHGPMLMPEAPNSRKLAQIMLQQLEGALLYAEGKTTEGLQIIAQTAADEDALTFEFGPPRLSSRRMSYTANCCSKPAAHQKRANNLSWRCSALLGVPFPCGVSIRRKRNPLRADRSD